LLVRFQGFEDCHVFRYGLPAGGISSLDLTYLKFFAILNTFAMSCAFLLSSSVSSPTPYNFLHSLPLSIPFVHKIFMKGDQ
jgi:hypothetical protein